MKKQELKICFASFQSIEELSKKDQKLVGKAIEATKTAYAPYSEFYVGAALRLATGKSSLAAIRKIPHIPAAFVLNALLCFRLGLCFQVLKSKRWSSRHAQKAKN